MLWQTMKTSSSLLIQSDTNGSFLQHSLPLPCTQGKICYQPNFSRSLPISAAGSCHLSSSSSFTTFAPSIYHSFPPQLLSLALSNLHYLIFLSWSNTETRSGNITMCRVSQVQLQGRGVQKRVSKQTTMFSLSLTCLFCVKCWEWDNK